MKKILPVLIIAVFAISSSAQDFKYVPSQHIVDQLKGEWPAFEIKIKPDTFEAITYKWKIVENTVPMDWELSLCDYNHCYAMLPSESEMAPISLEDAKSGTVGFFKLTFISYKTDTSAKMSFYVYDSKDESRGDTVSFTFTKAALAVAQYQATELKLYPNPASSTVQVPISDAKSTLRIANAQGKVVREHTNLPVGVFPMNLESLKKGIYFVTLEGKDAIRKSRLVLQ